MLSRSAVYIYARSAPNNIVKDLQQNLFSRYSPLFLKSLSLSLSLSKPYPLCKCYLKSITDLSFIRVDCVQNGNFSAEPKRADIRPVGVPSGGRLLRSVVEPRPVFAVVPRLLAPRMLLRSPIAVHRRRWQWQLRPRKQPHQQCGDWR